MIDIFNALSANTDVTRGVNKVVTPFVTSVKDLVLVSTGKCIEGLWDHILMLVCHVDCHH